MMHSVSVLKVSYKFGTIQVEDTDFRAAEEKVRQAIRDGLLTSGSPSIAWEDDADEARIELDPTL